MQRNDTSRATTGRTSSTGSDVIELGIASLDTKGPPGVGHDAVGELIGGEGLSHD
ncbi:hypothetical protein [Telmatospirillum sp.]|uniref:hypothetical protein n=1 Tax=Telmatospirillum sp. TaxID=2079197 RepID=UPI00284E8B64|nr:hypothetical protein [Telmatospirillum sp.]MDR3438113.1 hypothetical protein [Telmatospirillum sp.]